MDVNESMDHLKRNVIFSKIAVNVFDVYYLCVDYAEGSQLSPILFYSPYLTITPLFGKTPSPLERGIFAHFCYNALN